MAVINQRLFVTILLCVSFVGAAVQYGITTSPPDFSLSNYRALELFRRQDACSYGKCGNGCLSQGAFCCNPAGTDKAVPSWVCDDGTCITSIRGERGIVDCYDPDNPSGTTQSCIDNVPTTTCRSTDRCYTCATDSPYCHWETYINTNSPVLSWFYCLTASAVDATFYAATITGSATTSSHGAGSMPSSTGGTSTSSASGSRTLSTGTIVGIAVGGAAILILLVLLVWCIISRKRKRSSSPDPTHERSELPAVQAPVEMSHDETSRAEYFYAQPKQPLPPQGYPSPPPGYGADYHVARSLGSSSVVELPTPVRVENPDDNNNTDEILQHYQEERPYSWARDDDRGVVRHGNNMEH